MKFIEADRIKVTFVVDNYHDTIVSDPPCGKRFRTLPFKPSVSAEHGLSFFIEFFVEDRRGSLIFDFGINSERLLENMESLKITPYQVDSLGLSHGHYDHLGGLMGLLECLASKVWNKIPLFVDNGIFTHRVSIRQGKKIDLGRLKRKKIERLGKFKIEEINGVSEPFRSLYFAGNIEMETDYEKIPETFLVKRAGKLEYDSFSEEIVFFSIIKGKGLVIISGCAHRGIVNIVKYVQRITGTEKVLAILGGFHLTHAKPEVVERTVRDIKALSPDYVIPMHCTGFEALRLFAQEMPEQFILNTVGTTYDFCSSSKIKNSV